MYLIPLMNGDVVDFDEHKTGLRREGMYAGINSFITKPAISIAQWALLTIITAFGYDQTLAKGTQSASAQTGVLVGWVAPTGVLLLICFFALALYPLAGKSGRRSRSSYPSCTARRKRNTWKSTATSSSNNTTAPVRNYSQGRGWFILSGSMYPVPTFPPRHCVAPVHQAPV